LNKRQPKRVGAVAWDLPRDDRAARWQVWRKLSEPNGRFSKAVLVHQSSFVAFNDVEIAKEFAYWLRTWGAKVWLVNGSLTRVSTFNVKKRHRGKEHQRVRG